MSSYADVSSDVSTCTEGRVIVCWFLHTSRMVGGLVLHPTLPDVGAGLVEIFRAFESVEVLVFIDFRGYLRFSGGIEYRLDQGSKNPS